MRRLNFCMGKNRKWPDMKYVLDARKMPTRDEAHEYLKMILELPEYYGKNLDALYDCLCDMENAEIEIHNMTEEDTFILRVVNVMNAAGVKVEIV